MIDRYAIPIGTKFGRLEVLEDMGIVSHQRSWRCQCLCGNFRIMTGSSLTRPTKNARSCGCRSRELLEHRNQFANSSRLPAGQASLNKLASSYRNDAKRRSIVFKLTQLETKTLLVQDCFYCGSKPKRSFLTKSYKKKRRGRDISANGAILTNGIDRSDNSLGYVTGNVVPCCWICNRAKSAMNTQEFLTWIDELVQYRSAK